MPCRAEGHFALHALCMGVRATCILVRDLILAGNVCEVRVCIACGALHVAATTCPVFMR